MPNFAFECYLVILIPKLGLHFFLKKQYYIYNKLLNGVLFDWIELTMIFWQEISYVVMFINQQTFNSAFLISKVRVLLQHFPHLVCVRISSVNSTLLKNYFQALWYTNCKIHLKTLPFQYPSCMTCCLPPGFTFILETSKESSAMAAWQLL